MASVSILHVEKRFQVNILQGYKFICITSNPLTLSELSKNTSYNIQKIDKYVKKRIFCFKSDSPFIFDLCHDPTQNFVYDLWKKIDLM